MIRDLKRVFSRAQDISVPVWPGMTVYPGDCETASILAMEPGPGQPVSVTHWTLSAHAGTHLDAPSHFIPGARRIDQFRPSELFFRALVTTAEPPGRNVDIAQVRRLEVHLRDCDAVLFRTRSDARWTAEPFDTAHGAILHDAAEKLAHMDHLRLVGIDYLTVEPPGAEPELTHLHLLGAGKLILESVDLSGVEDGFHGLICLPLALRDAEAAPTRAVLIPERS